MKKRLVLTLLVLVGICWNVSAQRGSDSVSGNKEIVDSRLIVSPQGKQWAIFIAIDDYKELSPLQYPVKDAQEIKKILLDHYHIDQVRELYNRDATVSAIRRLFVELQEKTEPNDSVFVFHAGHGTNEDKTKTPAWMPYDAGNDIYTQANWLTHLQVRSMLDALKAKHVFLISDSCFSGDLLDATRGAADTVVNYPSAYDKVSRQAMSSGASEVVEDVSEFASRLKNTLLRTETPFITPDYLLSQIKEAKTMRPLFTIPILAAIPRSSHQLGGSFLFFRKNPKQSAAVQNTTEVTPKGEVPMQLLPLPQQTQPQAVQGEPGEKGYFVGSWIADIEHDGNYDTYEIKMTANGRCNVKIISDTAQQETNGNWSFDGTYFKLNATFRNPTITYQRSIQWVSLVSYGSGNNSFNILARPSANGSPIRFTFFRD